MSTLKDRISTKTDAITTAQLPTALAMHPAEVVIGQLVGVDPDGAPIVDFPGNPAGEPVPAIATARYDLVPAGQQIALVFISGDPARPLAIGLVTQPDGQRPMPAERKPDDPPECLTLAATREVVLQCGRARIVLTRAGKVLVQGAYVSSRSSGMQRITGASVHIN
jgi:hypothetical protein